MKKFSWLVLLPLAVFGQSGTYLDGVLSSDFNLIFTHITATNAVQRDGDTMTGNLTAPEFYRSSTSTIFEANELITDDGVDQKLLGLPDITNSVMAGASGGIVTSNNSGIVYINNDFSNYWETNVNAATSNIFIPIIAGPGANGVEITGNIKQPASDPYNLRRIYCRVNGIEGGPILYATHEYYYSLNSVGWYADTNLAFGGKFALFHAPYGVTNTICYFRAQFHEVFTTFPWKSYFSHSFSRAAGYGADIGYQMTADVDGNYEYGSVVTSIHLVVDTRLIETGSVIRVRRIP